MPELAEVEYYRTCWNSGLGRAIVAVTLHPEKRIFRSVNVRSLQGLASGAVLKSSESRGKRLLFRFSKDLWLGFQLGMTGKLSMAPPDFIPGKHDHLVLFQKNRALVFTDSRLFGRVHFHCGKSVPEWWANVPAPVNSSAFTRKGMERFLARHPKLPVKAALLLQAGFPGVGNWMADEILWRAGIPPQTFCAKLSPDQIAALWKAVRFVARGALQSVGRDFSDPPANWLFHQRWGRGGRCPIHDAKLQRETIGGRATAWCSECQPA